jgi:hypothetical protein
VVLQGYIKQEQGRLVLLLRIPLDLLASFGLPKRGPGYLDLARIGDRLKDVAAASARQIELRADGTVLTPVVRQARISLLSDRSFRAYASARAHVEGARLPPDTDLFWNQGFFDVELEYPLRSERPRTSIRVNVAPELGNRLKLQLEFLPEAQPARRYTLPGGTGWIALDPSGYEAAWLFLKAGFVAALTLDRFVFLLCLVAPFRLLRSSFSLVVPWIALQALAVSAASLGALAGVRWLDPLFGSTLAAAILLLAIGNLAAAGLRARFMLSAVLGLLSGFALGHALETTWQFAGTHPFSSALAFDLGVALAGLGSLALAVLALVCLDRILGAPLVVIILSAVVGHMAWHWILDRSHELEHELSHAAGSEVLRVALWLIPALLVGAAAWFLPKRFDAPAVPSLLAGLLAKQGPGESSR